MTKPSSNPRNLNSQQLAQMFMGAEIDWSSPLRRHGDDEEINNNYHRALTVDIPESDKWLDLLTHERNNAFKIMQDHFYDFMPEHKDEGNYQADKAFLNALANQPMFGDGSMRMVFEESEIESNDTERRKSQYNYFLRTFQDAHRDLLRLMEATSEVRDIGYAIESLSKGESLDEKKLNLLMNYEASFEPITTNLQNIITRAEHDIENEEHLSLERLADVDETEREKRAVILREHGEDSEANRIDPPMESDSKGNVLCFIRDECDRHLEAVLQIEQAVGKIVKRLIKEQQEIQNKRQ